MSKPWLFTEPTGGGGGSSLSGGSWRRRPCPPGPSISTEVGFSGKEIVISSDNEEDRVPPQEQQQPRLLAEVALMDKEFIRQMEIITERLLRHMGPVQSSPPHAVKEQPASPPCYRVKRKPC